MEHQRECYVPLLGLARENIPCTCLNALSPLASLMQMSMADLEADKDKKKKIEGTYTRITALIRIPCL